MGANAPAKPLEERFWPKVEIRGPAECWEWQGSLAQGYGQLIGTDHKTPVKAHRLAWEFAHERPVPDGLFVCHACDNRACVNPAHLFAGTARANTSDVIGTLNRQKTHCPKGHAYDEANTYVTRAGRGHGYQRACRTCVRERQDRDRMSRREAWARWKREHGYASV